MLIHFFHRTATHIIRFFHRLLGSSTVGVRAIVINPQNQVLLVRHTYSKGWYLPGGGVKNKETPKAAVIRELKEETGVEVKSAPQLVNVYFHSMFGTNDYPILYLVKNFTQTKITCREIAECAWFDINKLPHDLSPATQRRLQEYFFNAVSSETW